MAKYILKYWFEHGGTCLWSANENAREKYNYPISNETLPISKDLVEELYDLEEIYQGCLDWYDPSKTNSWTYDISQEFKERATNAYNRLVLELGEDFEVINEIDSCL